MANDMIISEATIREIDEIIREGLFELEAVKYHRSGKKFEMMIWLPWHEFAEFRPICCYVYWKRMAWKAWDLILFDVIDGKLKLSDNVPFYELSTLVYSDGSLVLNTHYSVTITLSVSRLSGLLCERHEVRHDLTGWYPVLDLRRMKK